MKYDLMDKVMMFTMAGLGAMVWGIVSWGIYWALFCGVCK
jgi:hypothetical protein